jgi:hypothetical protein
MVERGILSGLWDVSPWIRQVKIVIFNRNLISARVGICSCHLNIYF